MGTLRLIGDVHGVMSAYRDLIEYHEYSLQLGDMGFGYAYKTLRALVDPKKHRFIAGNHDDYSQLPPHALVDYGLSTRGGDFSFFYVRGGYSIDKKMRRKGVDWWEEEELTEGQFLKAAIEYHHAEPMFMFTHEPPQIVQQEIGNPSVLKSFGLPRDFVSRTSQGLQAMYLMHQPMLWVFGHFHKSWRKKIGHTLFICLDELEVLDLTPSFLAALDWLRSMHMRPVDFPQRTVTYAKDQPEYLPLPAHRDDEGIVTTVWALTWGERLKVLLRGRLYLRQMTFNQPMQPQSPSIDNPLPSTS